MFSGESQQLWHTEMLEKQQDFMSDSRSKSAENQPDICTKKSFNSVTGPELQYNYKYNRSILMTIHRLSLLSEITPNKFRFDNFQRQT